jgi:MFS family permease
MRRHLLIFFAVAYFSQGLAGGLITQPLVHYLKSLGMAADQVTQSLAMAAIPWLIKPLYGLVSDFVPFFGYRRKSYLVVVTTAATFAYLWLAKATAPTMILSILFLTTLATAAGDVLTDAIMVESGQRTGLIQQFQGQQWTSLNLAAITTGIVGGWLSGALSPLSALHTAAVIIACGPAAVLVTTLLFVDERPVRFNPDEFHRTTAGLLGALRSKALLTVGGFLAFWNATPSFSIPVYYHMTDQLAFEQTFIGQLNSIGSVGAALGALLYQQHLAGRFDTKRLLRLSIVLNVATALGYLFLTGPASAGILYFASGVVSMVALLTLFSLAAWVCPRRVEGFAFAALMSVYSLAGQMSAMTGGYLYDRVFHHHIGALILVAASFSLFAFLWLPFLPSQPPAAKALAEDP